MRIKIIILCRKNCIETFCVLYTCKKNRSILCEINYVVKFYAIVVFNDIVNLYIVVFYDIVKLYGIIEFNS